VSWANQMRRIWALERKDHEMSPFALPRAGRLVQEEISITGRRFRTLVDRDDDRLQC
jgi:hypothetical protein